MFKQQGLRVHLALGSGGTRYFKSFSLWFSWNCHDCFQQKCFQPSTAREKVTKDAELKSMGNWVKGRMKCLWYNCSLFKHSFKLITFFPRQTSPCMEHYWTQLAFQCGWIWHFCHYRRWTSKYLSLHSFILQAFGAQDILTQCVPNLKAMRNKFCCDRPFV